MRSGRLRHRVTIERRTTTTDAHGDQLDTWTTMATVWAAIEPLNGREYFAASGEASEVTARIRLRYQSELAGMTTADRVTHNGVNYDIRSVINPEQRGMELVLMCSIGARNG